jgi:hypothetical protein
MEPMKPMAPMKPMEPLKPMEPMKKLDFGPAWWPSDLGQPNSSGAQNGVRYAFFGATHRLAIERDGKLEIYDSGNHEINGVSQQQSSGQSLTFSSQNGNVNIQSLRKI